jgi:hypothetical protein
MLPSREFRRGDLLQRHTHLPDRLASLLRMVVYILPGDLFGPESRLFPLWAEYELDVNLLTLGRTCYRFVCNLLHAIALCPEHCLFWTQRRVSASSDQLPSPDLFHYSKPRYSSRTAFLGCASNLQFSHYHFYLGRTKVVQFDYTETLRNLQQA